MAADYGDGPWGVNYGWGPVAGPDFAGTADVQAAHAAAMGCLADPGRTHAEYLALHADREATTAAFFSECWRRLVSPAYSDPAPGLEAG